MSSGNLSVSCFKHFTKGRFLYLQGSRRQSRMLVLENEGITQVAEARRYKPEGRGFDSRWFR
jgi:hypothetical protein